MEESLSDFVKETRSHGLAMTTEMLQLKERQLAAGHGNSGSQFKASRGWVQKYPKRAGLSFRRQTSIMQRLPADYAIKLKSQRYIILIKL